MLGCRAVRWLLAGLLLAQAKSAAAIEPVGLGSFEWSAPPGCPAAAVVRQSLAELIELDRARWDRFESIRGRVSAGRAGWQLELRFAALARTQARHFEARDCADLGELAALTLALALDPDSRGWQELEQQSVAGTGSDHSDNASSAVAVAVAGTAPPPPNEGRATPEALLPPVGAAAAASSHTTMAVGVGGLLDPMTLGVASFGASLWASASRGSRARSVVGSRGQRGADGPGRGHRLAGGARLGAGTAAARSLSRQ
jgi:hypothetical protein